MVRYLKHLSCPDNSPASNVREISSSNAGPDQVQSIGCEIAKIDVCQVTVLKVYGWIDAEALEQRGKILLFGLK